MNLQIRPIVLGLVKHPVSPARLLLCEFSDPFDQRRLYRAPGGGIEFGEMSFEALQREFREELQAELTNIRYLGCLENRFTYAGKPGHELVQLYQCDFVDSSFYEQEVLQGWENDQPFTAIWAEIDWFKSGRLHLVPEGCLDYL